MHVSKQSKHGFLDFCLFVLNDKVYPVKVLLVCAAFGGFLSLLASLGLFWFFGFHWGFQLLMLVLLVLFVFKVYSFWSLGGLRAVEGLTVGGLVFGKDRMREVNKKC